MDENKNFYFNNMCNSSWPSQQPDRNNEFSGSHARCRSSALREYYHLEGDGSYSDSNSEHMSDLNSNRSLGSNSYHSAFQYQHMDLERSALTRRYSSIDEYPANPSFSRESFHDRNYEIMCQSLQAELKRKRDSLNEMEKQKQELKDENHRLNVQLALERRKAVNINKKIKSIQENQAVLIRLKEEYTSSKANQNYEKQTNTVDNECQTDENYECPNCITTFHWRQKMSEEERQRAELEKDTIQVKLSQINAIESTIGLLKSKLQDSTLGFATLNNFANDKYLKNIRDLKTNIQLLQEEKDKLEKKNISLENTINFQNCTISKQKVYKDILKRIIVKLERRQRQMIKEFNIKESKSRPTISHQEKVIVQEIVRRFIMERKFGKRASQACIRSDVHRTESLTILTNSTTTATDISGLELPNDIDYLAPISFVNLSNYQERTSLKTQFLTENYEADAKQNNCRPRSRSWSNITPRHANVDSIDKTLLKSKSSNDLQENHIITKELLVKTGNLRSEENKKFDYSKKKNNFDVLFPYCGDQTKTQINDTRTVPRERIKKMKGRFSLSTKK